MYHYAADVMLQVSLKEWEAAEAAKRALQKEVALKLKADREQQLAERNMVSSKHTTTIV